MKRVIEVIAGDGIDVRTEEREDGKVVVTVTANGTTGTIDTSTDLDGESASDLVVPSQLAVKSYVDTTVGTLETTVNALSVALTALDGRVTVLEGA